MQPHHCLQMEPQDFHAIWSNADGNCMCRAASTGYCGDESMHLEIRARTVLSGIVHKEHYVTDECLKRGASLIRNDETLPEIYVKYSDHYVNGQRITLHTVDYIYLKELLDCAKVNSYMGLWQLAQVSTALNVPIQSVFPEGTDPEMRLDFHRVFFSIDWNEETQNEPIILMWTSLRKGCYPNHFVPLLPKRKKYAPFNCI